MRQKRATTADPLHVFLHAAFFDYSSRHLEGAGKERLATMPYPKRRFVPLSGEVGESIIKELADMPPTWIPMMVNGILSVELYLKAILTQEEGGKLPEQSHKLSELYFAVSDDGRMAIEELFKEAFSKDDVSRARRDASDTPTDWDLIPLLERHNDAFVKIRYSYESPVGWEYQSLMSIRIALYSYCVQTHPSWRAAAERSGIR